MPAPVFVEADEVVDGLGEGDDGRGEDGDRRPVVDGAGNVLGRGDSGNDPGVGEHERVNDGEAGGVEKDGDDVAEADPIRTGDIDGGADDGDEHDEHGGKIDDVPDGRQGDKSRGGAEEKILIGPEGLQPEKRDAAGDQDGDGVETRYFFWPGLNLPFDLAFDCSLKARLKIHLAPIVRLAGEVFFDKREDERDRRELEEELKDDARKEVAEVNRLAGERKSRKDNADDEKRETEVESEDADVKREEDGADQLRAEGERALIGRVGGGDLERIAASPDDFELLGFGERAAKFRFLVFDFGTDVFRQFAKDVFALVGGEELCEIAEIAIERLHEITLSRFRREMRRWLSIRRGVFPTFPGRGGRAGKTVCCAFPLRAIR